MSKQKLEAGELFAVPGAIGGVFGLTKVIFVSAYYKNLMLIRLFPERAADPTALPIPAPEAQSALYYTGVDSIKRGNWVHLGKQAVTAEELAMTERVSSREVWIEDSLREHQSQLIEQNRIKRLDVRAISARYLAAHRRSPLCASLRGSHQIRRRESAHRHGGHENRHGDTWRALAR